MVRLSACLSSPAFATMQTGKPAVPLRTLILLLVHIALLLPRVTVGVSPIVVRGRHLVDSVTQRRFFVKGSGYDYVSTSALRTAMNATMDDCRLTLCS